MTIKFQAKHKSGFTVDHPLTPFTFPAGEAHIKGDEKFVAADYKYSIADLRGHDPQDLFHLAMFNETLVESAVDEGVDAPLVILLPYLPGARADRGNPLGAAVYASFINDIVPTLVITLDPHSHVMPELLANLTVFPFARIIKNEIQDGSSDSAPQPYVGVIAPDKGARERAAAAATVMGVPVYTAGKTRNFETGQLTGFHMEDELPSDGKFLIVDDICDGGGTFIGLANAIHETNPNVILDLWVTHGVFSQGWSKVLGGEDPLTQINHIHTTDSYYVPSGTEVGYVTVHKLAPYLYPEINNYFADSSAL